VCGDDSIRFDSIHYQKIVNPELEKVPWLRFRYILGVRGLKYENT